MRVKNEAKLHKLDLSINSTNPTRTVPHPNGKVAKGAPATALPKKFTVILADNPWPYRDPKATKGGVGHSIQQ